MRDIQKVLSALASPVRREILTLIWDTELPAGAIAAEFAVTKPTISQHLAVLRDAGLVKITAAGTSRRYQARQEALRGLRGALGNPAKWNNATGVPERALASARTSPVVIVSAEVAADPDAVFTAFTDQAVYSRWLGVPVTIRDGRFDCTMEWGTRIRGRYELVVPPELIVMRWDFDDGNIPVPGGEMTGYLRISPALAGSHVEVHQLVDTAAHAEFMQTAWSTVLGRLAAGVTQALDPATVMPARPVRRKRGSAEVSAR